MSSCNSAHMANNLMRWWRSKFYKGYKPFTVDNAELPASDSEELLGSRRSFDCRISSTTTPPVYSNSSTNSLPIITDLHSTTQQALPHVNLQEFSCNVSLDDAPSLTLKDRQEFLFTLYDFDGHGKITKDDITGLVTTIYNALGSSIKVPHCGSKTIKVKLTVSPDQRKHLSTSVINNPTMEEKPEEKLNFNVTIKQAADEDKSNNKEQEGKKRHCCRKMKEELQVVPDVSDEYFDACSRMSADATATEDECEQKHNNLTKTYSANVKEEFDVYKHESYLHTKKVKKRVSFAKQDGTESQTNIDSNHESFYKSRKLNADHGSLENNQLPHDVKPQRHRHHRHTHSQNNTNLHCMANVDPTHFYVDPMMPQNNTQICNDNYHYDKLVNAVMCVSNKKITECHKRHNHIQNCDISNSLFHCQLVEDSTKQGKSAKKHTKKQNDYESPALGNRNARKLPRFVIGHTSSPHHLRHRNRQEDQARAMAQVVLWLEQEFSNNSYTNTGEERTKSANCESNNKEHPCGIPKNQNYYTDYHEHHHVHEHIHNHYHHYQKS